MSTKTPTIAEAEAALERAREAEQQAAKEQRAKAEAAAQADHDRAMAKVIDELERDTERVIADAARVAMAAPVSREAAAPARGFFAGVELGGGQPRMVEATRHDPAAAMLHNQFETVVAKFNSLTLNRQRNTRNIGEANGQRLTDLERRCWGALVRRLRTVAGEE